MKKSLFALILAVAASTAFSQGLADLYKKGTIRLIPDAEYAKDNNWDKVFNAYYDPASGKPAGSRKSLVVMPDGSVVINNSAVNYYSEFSPDGKFDKEFVMKNGKGAQIGKAMKIEGTMNDNAFITELDITGNMNFYDFSGNFVKTLKLDYMSSQVIPLPGNKIAVVGWAIWKTKFRDFVSIVDYGTNVEKIIWEKFTDRNDESGNHMPFNYSYKSDGGSTIVFTSMPYSVQAGMSSPPRIVCVKDKLVIAVPNTGEILVYTLDGTLVSKEKIPWANELASVEEQKAIQQKAIDNFKNMKSPDTEKGTSPENIKAAKDQVIKQMEEDLAGIKEPLLMPAFSTIIKDSDGNLLFFEFPKEESGNRFNVWIFNNGGKFVCASSFVCDDYQLDINPSRLVFHNGDLYGLQNLKKASGVPLRLVRFKLTGN
jgi:hypothetical protein